MSKHPSAQEILDRISAKRAGSDVSAANVNQPSTAATPADLRKAFVAADRASIKDRMRDIDSQTAHLLKNKDEVNYFNRSAPSASEQSTDISVAGDVKTLAPAAATPPKLPASSEQHKSDAVEPCSPHVGSEEKLDKRGASSVPTEDDADFSDLEGIEVEPADTELSDPNFFKIRYDLFDNGKAKNQTRFRGKLSCQIHQDDTKDQVYEVYANFYNRGRDVKKHVKAAGMWCSFYDDIWNGFEDERRAQRDYEIVPHIATLKERDGSKPGAGWVPLLYTVSIMWKEVGCDPVVFIIYEKFSREMALDFRFKKTQGSTLTAVGIYVDPERVAFDSKPQAASAMTRRDPSFFKR